MLPIAVGNISFTSVPIFAYNIPIIVDWSWSSFLHCISSRYSNHRYSMRPWTVASSKDTRQGLERIFIVVHGHQCRSSSSVEQSNQPTTEERKEHTQGRLQEFVSILQSRHISVPRLSLSVKRQRGLGNVILLLEFTK